MLSIEAVVQVALASPGVTSSPFLEQEMIVTRNSIFKEFSPIARQGNGLLRIIGNLMFGVIVKISAAAFPVAGKGISGELRRSTDRHYAEKENSVAELRNFKTGFYLVSPNRNPPMTQNSCNEPNLIKWFERKIQK